MAAPANGVPYQAYRSKRHSRTPSNVGLSNPTSPAAVDVSQPVLPVSSPNGKARALDSNGLLASDSDPASAVSSPQRKHAGSISSLNGSINGNGNGRADVVPWERANVSPPLPPRPTLQTTPPAPPIKLSSPPPATSSMPLPSASPARAPQPDLPPSPSSSTSSPVAGRRTSTFRRVPLRAVSNATQPVHPSPLRPSGAHTRTISLSSANLAPAPPAKDSPRTRLSSYFGGTSSPAPSISQSISPLRGNTPLPTSPANEIAQPSARPATSSSPSITPSLSPAPASTPSPAPRISTASPAPSQIRQSISGSSRISTPTPRTPAPYRPGFQPRGVYRPRTDEFVEARALRRDVGRVERARLERRLEKLIALHFGPGASSLENGGLTTGEKEKPHAPRRMSSLWDLGSAAADAWKGGGVGALAVSQGGKADIRAAEQAIAAWEPDNASPNCFSCGQAFHALTNRRHHCRLCGRLVCALPPKRPQRPVACSTLFVAEGDGRIEEVKEGVDYGVRKRAASNAGKEEGEDKFLKGVRICRECRPVLLRKQFAHEADQTPLFARLYALLLALEQDILDQLPHFRELVYALSTPSTPVDDHASPHHSSPHQENAAAARKKLVAAFAQYDAAAKRIRALPAEKGSSQARVQAAVVVRANAFLQEHMVPLQSLPTLKSRAAASSPSTMSPDLPVLDSDTSQEAHAALQPLLEQEALLEAFVEQAVAGRKFEDAKTLRANLEEIRGEIARVVRAQG
ncbi:unnamed protein product [Peniophora sp. CBMAI 1063]|nr:unnamed protein product [Peniophora sp. CBMAI 1063]